MSQPPRPMKTGRRRFVRGTNARHRPLTLPGWSTGTPAEDLPLESPPVSFSVPGPLACATVSTLAGEPDSGPAEVLGRTIADSSGTAPVDGTDAVTFQVTAGPAIRDRI